jgi:hypothetical protein
MSGDEMACAKVARRKGGISAKLGCTSRLSARMLIKIRNLEVVMSRRLNVLHALSNVLQAECRGFRIGFKHSQQQAHHNRQIPMSKYRYEVRREDPSVQTRRSMSGPASQGDSRKKQQTVVHVCPHNADVALFQRSASGIEKAYALRAAEGGAGARQSDLAWMMEVERLRGWLTSRLATKPVEAGAQTNSSASRSLAFLVALLSSRQMRK